MNLEFFSLIHGSLVIGGMNIVVATLCSFFCLRILRKRRKDIDHTWAVLIGFASIGYVFNEFRWMNIILNDVHAGVAVHGLDEFTWSALEWCWLTGSMLLARDKIMRECTDAAGAKPTDTTGT